MSDDLYASLGVSPTADDAEIKRAHRSKVRKTHPDAGGDRAEFDKVQRAYMVLSDPEKRSKYDRTGTADERPENMLSAQALTMIAQKLGMLVSEPTIDPTRCKVDVAIRQALQADKGAAQAQAAESERLIKRLEQFRKRLKAKGESNALTPVLDAQIMEQKSRVGACEDAVKVVEIALEILAGYLYEVDAAPPPSAGGAYAAYHDLMRQQINRGIFSDI